MWFKSSIEIYKEIHKGGLIRQWKTLQNELHNFYFSPIKSRRIRGAGNVVRVGAMWYAYNIFAGKHEGKRLLVKYRHRGEVYIKDWFREKRYSQKGLCPMELVMCECVKWIQLAQDRDQWRSPVNTVMNLRILYKEGNFSTSWATVYFSRGTLPHGVCQLVRCEGVKWIQLAQDRDQWQALENTIRNIPVPCKEGNFSCNWVTVCSQEGLCSIELVMCECVKWIQLAQDRVQWRSLVDTITNIRISYKEGNFNFSRWNLLRRVSWM
jgi:hypothetical protein